MNNLFDLTDGLLGNGAFIGPATAPATPLAKDGAWPTTGNIGGQYSYPIKWTGGTGEIKVVVRKGITIVNDTTYPAGTTQALISGQDKTPTGAAYTITVTDQAGGSLTGNMTFSYVYYVGFRKQGDGTTVPATTAPFAQSSEGVQTLALTVASGAYLVNFSKYTKGGTVVESGGTNGCVMQSSGAAATIVKNNDFTATITPTAAGTATLRITTANGDATGLLTINIT